MNLGESHLGVSKTAVVSVLLIAVASIAATGASSAEAKVRMLDATAGLPAGERAVVRVVTGKGEKWCALSARSKKVKAGRFVFRVANRKVNFTWKVPAKVASRTWTVSIACAKTKKLVKTVKRTRFTVSIDGTRRGKKKLIKPGSLKVRSAAWLERNSRVKPGSSIVANDDPRSAYSNRYDYGYCTWYVFNRRPDLEPLLGNAEAWYRNTRKPKGSKPVAGAVAWWNSSRGEGYGHVAYVEQVSGNRIRISEMNRVGWNIRSERWITLGTHDAPHGYIYGGPAGNGPGSGPGKTPTPEPPKPIDTTFDTSQLGRDFNGDGIDDIAAFYGYDHSQTRIFTFSGSSSGGLGAPVARFDSGRGNWEGTRVKPLAGDFNGDGKDDVAVFYGYDHSQTKIFTFPGTDSGLSGTATARFDSGRGNWDWNRTR